MGPATWGWGLQEMTKLCPPGKDKHFFNDQADNALNDAALMRRIGKGWLAFGETDPWSVVHPGSEKQMAWYNSDSLLI